jgi:hypothetical protein
VIPIKLIRLTVIKVSILKPEYLKSDYTKINFNKFRVPCCAGEEAAPAPEFCISNEVKKT